MESIKSGAKLVGTFDIKCFRKGKLIWREICKNVITDEGLDHILDMTLHSKTDIHPWYCVLSESDEAADAGMTYAVDGFVETTAYDEPDRPEWTEGASSSQSVTNAAVVVFTISDSKTMYGAGLKGGIDTKGDSTSAATHVLLCYSKFGTAREVIDNDVINLTYTIVAADDAP